MFDDLPDCLLQALKCYRTISNHVQLNSQSLLKCKAHMKYWFYWPGVASSRPRGGGPKLLILYSASWVTYKGVKLLHSDKKPCHCAAFWYQMDWCSWQWCKCSTFWVLSLGLDPALPEGVPFLIQLSDIKVTDDKAASIAVYKVKLVKTCRTH